MDANEAGPIFAEFLANELKSERERRATLDQRGIAVVTSSSTLVTLLSGLVAFIGLRGGTPKPGIATLVALALSLLSFVIAAFYGLATNRSQTYTSLDERSLRLLREDDAWNLPPNRARWLIYGENVTMMQMLRSGNNQKSRLVNRALSAQLSALAFLALTILIGVIDIAAG
jgi:hypothetical protein